METIAVSLVVITWLVMMAWLAFTPSVKRFKGLKILEVGTSIDLMYDGKVHKVWITGYTIYIKHNAHIQYTLHKGSSFFTLMNGEELESRRIWARKG